MVIGSSFHIRGIRSTRPWQLTQPTPFWMWMLGWKICGIALSAGPDRSYSRHPAGGADSSLQLRQQESFRFPGPAADPSHRFGSSVDDHAAVGMEDLARDVGGILGGEEHVAGR